MLYQQRIKIAMIFKTKIAAKFFLSFLAKLMFGKVLHKMGIIWKIIKIKDILKYFVWKVNKIYNNINHKDKYKKSQRTNLYPNNKAFPKQKNMK
jgi:hypothetical protein